MNGPEYVTDVTYVRSFESDLSPTRLRLAAALNGFAPPPADGFDYCELGSAHGDTLATLAAAYPAARFVGVDLNREHIASANELARRGELQNVRFLEKDFEDLGEGELPPLDFIAAHGVWSWVSPEKRRALLALASSRLKPGGLLYVSYNALPGWAAVEPLRQLIAGRAAIAPGDSVARARAGVHLARTMSQLGAEYFTSNPAARTMLGKMEKLGLAYVVHEYLHAHWTPMYFSQVAREMADEDLYFVGQLPPFLNFRDLAVPATLAPVFAGILDRVAFESLKDFAINEYFRRDVFTKGRSARADATMQAYFDETPFGGPLEGGRVPSEVGLPHHGLRYTGELFDALLPALDLGASTATGLAARPELGRFGLPRIRDAIMRLALGEAVTPMLAPTERALATPEASYRLQEPYNRAALREGLSREVPITLASRAAGTGVEVSSIEGVALHLLTEIPVAEREAWVRTRCARDSFRLTVRGEAVQGREAQVRTLLAEIERFYATRLPKLVELGILTPA